MAGEKEENKEKKAGRNSGSLGDLLTGVAEQGKREGKAVGPEDVPIVKIVDELLRQGIQSKASDIHIEPSESKTLVRFRIDGILHDVSVIPADLHELIATRIKILSRLRTDEHHATQDGKLRFIFQAEPIDVRVSIVPANFGEKLVLRILSEQDSQNDLESIGFSERDMVKINKYYKRPWGLILATGPTGSGKTTTLYGLLKKLNRREVNISTIEDPIEYSMESVNQVQVNPRTNLDFAAGLRALLRQDPDVIMVGEIRDHETASVAINAAMTGHLVLSTLHTNDAATTLPRLIDMGIQPFLVASTINLAIAQRLVRKICQDCREVRRVPDEVLVAARKQLPIELIQKHQLDAPAVNLYYGKGCSTCDMSGYRGRTIIAEVLEMTDGVKALIMDERNASEIEDQARKEGMVTIIEDGLEKIFKGVTTLEELLRVAQD